MSAENFVTIIGNVTRDPEQRFTPNGASVVAFGVAVNRRWLNKTTNEWEDDTSFFDVKAWSQLGENVAQSVYKGDRVTVAGRLDQSSWEDKDTATKRSKVEVVADDVSLSLRWATVPSVVKNEKKESGGRGGGGRPAEAGGRPGQAPAGRGGGGRPTPESEHFAEEPF